MKKNIFKILALICAVVMLPSYSVLAGEVEILFPADGSVIENVDKEVEFVSSGGDVIMEIDGKRTESNSLLLKASEMTIGKHNLKVYEVLQDGSVNEGEACFTVSKSKSESVISANLNNPSTATLTASTVELGDNVNVIPQKNQTGYATVSVIERGEGDKAVNLTSENGFSKPRPFTNTVFPKTVKSKIEIKHDIKLNNLDTKVWYELYTGDKAYYFNGTKLFDDGKVFGKKYEYDADTWYTVRLIFDFSKRVYSVFLGEDAITENAEIETKGVDCASFRINYESGKSGGGFSFDNVYVNEIPSYEGISDVKFIYGEEETEDKKPDAQKIAGGKIYFEDSVTEGDVLPYVTLSDEEGKNIKLTSAKGISSEKSIEFTVADKLEINRKYTILTDIKINDSDDTSGAKCSYTFKTAPGEFDINSVSFLSGESKAVSIKQLKNASLKTEIDFKNIAGGKKTVTLLLTVREDDALLSVAAKKAEIEEKDNAIFEVESSILNNVKKSASVQLMIISSVPGAVPLFEIINYNISGE